MKHDRIALRILEILAQNCRVPHAVIAKALNVSKDTVAYRIRQMEESGLLRQYMMFVDSRRFGFTRYHILIQFDSGRWPMPAQINAVIKHPAVMWTNSFIGRFDLQIIVDARDGFELNRTREDLFRRLGQNVKHYSIMTHIFDLEFTQLNPVLELGTKFQLGDNHSFGKSITKRRFPVGPEFEKRKIDRIDNELLYRLSDDPRMQLTELARKCGIDRLTVRKRIKRLIDEGVILNFGAIPNLDQLGFVTYYLLIRLSQKAPVAALRRPFQKLRNIFYAGSMIGDYDMIAYLNARTPDELNSSVTQFRRDLGEYIVNFDLLVQERVHFWKQFTKGLYGHLSALNYQQRVE